MQEDLLAEFHIPEIEVKRLQSVLEQTSVRLVNILKKHDEFIKKTKIIPPHYEKLTKSILSDFKDVSEKFIKADDSITINGNCGINVVPIKKFMTLQRSIINGENADNTENIENIENTENTENTENIKNIDKKKAKEQTSQENLGKKVNNLATNLGWGSDDDDEIEVFEVGPCPSRLHVEHETAFPWELDFSLYKSTLINRSGEFDSQDSISYCPLFGNWEPEKVTSPKSDSISCIPVKVESSPDQHLTDKIDKPIRCYSSKKFKYKEIAQTLTESPEVVGLEEKERPFCVISEVVGNANEAFAGCHSETDEIDPPVITPKKTNDITKIKGWRRKQFFVEKPTTVEFFSFEMGADNKKMRLDGFGSCKKVLKDEEPGNIENAFVCDSLDNFLDREANLNVQYKIPHLFAEVGIKLTSEDVVSKPNLSAEDFEKVGNKYCVNLPPMDDDVIVLEEFDTKKREKRRHEDVFESYKIFKVDKNKRRAIKTEQKHEVLQEIGNKSLVAPKCSEQTEESNGENPRTVPKTFPPDIHLKAKPIGVVVYPSFSKPLHPLVQRHLEKLRSYHTKMDKYWANFAVSAIKPKYIRKLIPRKILPVICVGKVEKNSSELVETVNSEVQEVVRFLVDSVCETCTVQAPVKSHEEFAEKKIKPEVRINRNNVSTQTLDPSPIIIKNCRVTIGKINWKNKFRLWCLEHNCHNCIICGHYKFNSEKTANTQPGGAVRQKRTPLLIDLSDPSDTESSSPFGGNIKNLLAKKLRNATFCDDFPTSIDKLKTFSPNTLELVKLNFVKQSFLIGYVSIWHLKPEAEGARSRAFLTFSKTPPIENAINIKSKVNHVNDLPKVITEIVTAGKEFDNDEYAILHCNGNLWEIHGCLNIAVDKNESTERNHLDVEQIFIPVPLREMQDIRRIAMSILRVKATKWWVLDVSQKFTEVILDIPRKSVAVSRKHIHDIINSKFLGFLILQKPQGRLYGAYILDTLFPYVLFGPYYVYECSKVFVKLNSNKVPLVYKGEASVPNNSSLKFYINSVINGFEQCDKKLDELWLYDKSSLDSACYLEASTTIAHGPLPKTDYSVEVEHDYSLNSLTNFPRQRFASGNYKSKDGGEGLEVTIYLYFEMIDLGYVVGELQLDNSVVISHPYKEESLRSHEIGDVFISLLKRRIRFIPTTLKPRWFVTKHREDLRGRLPFNKLCLGGAHILCRTGLYSLLKMTNSKIRELGLHKEEVIQAISASKIINEVAELKNLKTVVSEGRNENLPMGKVLEMAVKVIRDLRQTERVLARVKKEEKAIRIELWIRFVYLLNCLSASDDDKVEYLKNVLLKLRKTGETIRISENFKLVLDRFDVGRKFFNGLEGKIIYETLKAGTRNTGKRNNNDAKPQTTKNTITKASKSESKHKVGEKMAKPSERGFIKKLEAKLINICKAIDPSAQSSSVAEYKALIRKLNSISGQINSIKNIFVTAPKKPLKKSCRIKGNFYEKVGSVKKVTRKVSLPSKCNNQMTEEKMMWRSEMEENLKNKIQTRKKHVERTKPKRRRKNNQERMNGVNLNVETEIGSTSAATDFEQVYVSVASLDLHNESEPVPQIK